MFSKRLNPFFKQNTQDMLDDSDMVQFGGESWKDSPPPTLVLDEDDTSKGESMESWAEISGRSLSCRHGARWDLEQVFPFSPAGIISSKKRYH